MSEHPADSATSGLVEPSDKCDRYLSCVLVATPESYAAQLTLYGEDSACWKTDETSANCGIACETAFDKIADQCTCEGTICTPPQPFTCLDDSTYGENDQIQGSFDTGLGPDNPTFSAFASICPAADRDHYAVTLFGAAGAADIEIAVSWTGNANLGVSILNASGAALANDQTDPGSPAEIKLEHPPGELHYVVVHGQDEANYHLAIKVIY